MDGRGKSCVMCWAVTLMRCGLALCAAHRACATGSAKELAKILKAFSVPLDEGDSRRWTAFHVACTGGRVECVRLLLQSQQCDLELRNEEGITGWELAAQMKRAEVLAARADG